MDAFPYGPIGPVARVAEHSDTFPTSRTGWQLQIYTRSTTLGEGYEGGSDTGRGWQCDF